MKILLRFFSFVLIAGYAFSPVALLYAAAPAPTCSITLSTGNISIGGSVTVKWTSTNATGGAITNIGNVGASGSINLLPSSAARTTYLGSFTGPGGTANCSATVTVTSSGGGDASVVQNQPAPVAPVVAPVTTDTGNNSGLIPCGFDSFNTQGTGASQTGNAESSSTGCQACDLAKLIQTIITFVIGIAIPIAAAMFAYAGWLYFTSATNPANIGKAKSIFKNAFIGFLIAITGWLVINTVLNLIFSQNSEFAGGSWFSIQCVNPSSRPVNGDISTVLSGLPILGGSGGGNASAPSYDTNGTPIAGSGGGSGTGANALDNAVYNGYDQALAALQSSCTAGGDSDSYSCYGLKSLQDAGAVTDSAVEALQDACTDGDKASCTAATTASAAVGDNYDKVKASLDSSCSAGNQDSCTARDSLVKAGAVTDTAYETLLSNCQDSSDTASCNALKSIVPSTPSQEGKGDCSVSALSDTWGSNAAVMSCVAQGESSCVANRPSQSDRGKEGDVFSYGLYQINISSGVDKNGNMIASDPHNLNTPSCMALNGGQPLNCAQAFSGTNYNSKVVNQSIYQSCVNAASNAQCNTEAATTLFNQVQSKAGTAAAYAQWSAYKDNKCGG